MDNLIKFVEPYYNNKDIMHNMWHIELVIKQINNIIKLGNYNINYEELIYATYLHGIVYSEEPVIRKFLKEEDLSNDKIDRIINISLESQRYEVPSSLEGKILHDAHVLEGGKTYLVVKTLITGSIRGQNLKETLAYMQDNVLNKNKCYLKETIPLCEEMNKYTNDFYKELTEDLFK